MGSRCHGQAAAPEQQVLFHDKPGISPALLIFYGTDDLFIVESRGVEAPQVLLFRSLSLCLDLRIFTVYNWVLHFWECMRLQLLNLSVESTAFLLHVDRSNSFFQGETLFHRYAFLFSFTSLV